MTPGRKLRALFITMVDAPLERLGTRLEVDYRTGRTRLGRIVESQVVVPPEPA